MRTKSWFISAAAMLLTAMTATAAPSGGGGTAIYPVMSLWAQDYYVRTGVKMNYQPIGSGGGIRQSLSRTIDFGNTDMPLAGADLAKGKLVQFPIVFIAIVPVVNLPGVGPGALTLDGPVLADLYRGKIRHWNDPAIARLNPGMRLPALPVIVVHRSDASGTTFHFTSYLAAVSPAWKDAVGAGAAVAWPTGSAGKGNAGVVAVLQRAVGAVGYVEYAYAQQNRLAFTGLVNRAGARVLPGSASFRAAAAGADFSRDGSPIAPNAGGAGSWPLTAATYMLLHADGDKAVNREILRFLAYALKDGRAKAESLHYVPLPPAVAAGVEAAWPRQLGVSP
jgi:phosphate transport system substrate-binding protein